MNNNQRGWSRTWGEGACGFIACQRNHQIYQALWSHRRLKAFSESDKGVGNERTIVLVYLWSVRLWSNGNFWKTVINLWLFFLSMSTVAKDFTLDESAAFPLLFKCRPRAQLQHLYTERTRLKVAEEMGKACSECSLSVSMSFALQIREITAPCQPVSQETRVGEAESFPWYRSNDHRNNGPRWKGIFLIIQRVVGRSARSGSESSRRCCLLIQNSVSVSQSVLSKIPTLSWVQSHVGAIMGRRVQQRWFEGTSHQLFRRVQKIGGPGREEVVFLYFRTSSLWWQHPKQMHFTF